jgi:hypothetical protein
MLVDPMAEGASKTCHGLRIGSPGAQFAELIGFTNADRIV